MGRKRCWFEYVNIFAVVVMFSDTVFSVTRPEALCSTASTASANTVGCQTGIQTRTFRVQAYSHRFAKGDSLSLLFFMWSFPVGVTLQCVGATENIVLRLSPLLDGLWILGTRNSAVGIVTRVQISLSGVRIPVGARDFSLFQIVLTGCVAHPTSYSVGTGVLSVE